MRRHLVGHAAQERDLLDAYRSGRLPHAIILGGPAGIGKATLAWRLAKFLLANPLPQTRAVSEADDLSVPRDSKAAAQVAAQSHPDVGLLRREVNDKTKRFYTEIRADDVRKVIGLFQRAAGAGGVSHLHRRLGRRPQSLVGQCAPEADRGAAAALALSADRASSRPRAADDPVAFAARALARTCGR